MWAIAWATGVGVGKLTAKGVAALKLPGRYADGNGLHLRIDSAGRRYWVVRAQVDGKRRDINLSPEARMTLAEAREATVALRAKMARGGPLVRDIVTQVPLSLIHI